MRRASLIALVYGATAMASTAVAQKAEVKLKLDTNVLEVGESVNVQLDCVNTGPPEPPQVAVPDGLELKLLASSPSSSSFTQIVNGRVSQRSTFTFPMQLIALKEGTFTLGPLTVRAGGRTYRTGPVQVIVRNTQEASIPRGDRIVFVELSVEPKSVYVTQSYVARLIFGIRRVQISGRIYNVDMLHDVLDGRSSQLSVFSDGRATQGERWLKDSDGVAHRYEVFHVTKEVRAETVGEARVGPVFLKLNYPTQIQRGFFGGFQVTRQRRETARADAVTVQVKGPPEEGRPADYTGAIGRFTMAVSAKPTHVEQGQPITLAISIQGEPSEGVAGPDLTQHPELNSRFDFTHDELAGDMEQGAKVFRRAIFPKQPGEQTIPPIGWSYFDPQQERYVSLQSDPIAITVDPPSRAAGENPVLDQPKPKTTPTTLTLLTGGISPNYTNPSEVLADQTFTLTPAWFAVLMASPLTWLLVTVTTRYRWRLKADAGFARRRRAARVAKARINQALRDGATDAQLHGLKEAVTNYLADRFNLGTGTLTPAEVRSLLSSDGFDPALVKEIVDFLESCDAAHYAPGTMQTIPRSQAATHVRRWIKQMERSRA